MSSTTAAPSRHLTTAQRDVAAQWYPLACKVAMQFSRERRVHADECLSEAMLALCAAAHAFDPSREVPIGCYIARVVRMTLGRMHARGRIGRMHIAHAHLRVGLGEPSAIKSPRRDTRLDELMEALTPRERAAVTMRVRARMLHREIGPLLGGLTRGRSHQIHEIALKKMRIFAAQEAPCVTTPIIIERSQFTSVVAAARETGAFDRRGFHAQMLSTQALIRERDAWVWKLRHPPPGELVPSFHEIKAALGYRSHSAVVNANRRHAALLSASSSPGGTGGRGAPVSSSCNGRRQ